MGKKYLDTKRGTLESSVLGVWKEQNDFQETVMDVWETAAEQGIFEKNLDPVGQADDDIDNDGDVDSSDKYLHKRRKAISKAIKKEEAAPNKQKYVVHEHWGEGQPIHGMHAEPDEYGDIAWYDVMFEHGLERYVPIEELMVTNELVEKTTRQMTPKKLAAAQAKIDRIKDPKARKKAQAEFDKFLETQEAKPAKPPKQSAYTAAGTAAAKIAKEKIGKEGGNVPATVDKAETKRKVLDRSDIESGATAGSYRARAADRMATNRLKRAATAPKKSGVDPFGGVGVPKKSKPADTISDGKPKPSGVYDDPTGAPAPSKKLGLSPGALGGKVKPKPQVGTGDQHGGQKPVSAEKPKPQVGTGDQHGRPKDADPNRSDAKAARKAAAVPKKPTQGGDELGAAPAPKAPKDTAAAKKKEPKDDPTEGGKYAYYIKDPEKRKKSFWGSAMYRTDKEDPEEESQESYIYTSQDFKVQSMREALEFIRENND